MRVALQNVIPKGKDNDKNLPLAEMVAATH